MGITISAKNSPISFECGCGGFFRLRCNIAKYYDKELGELYSQISLSRNEYLDKRINDLLKNTRFKNEDCDILDFLFSSDVDGEIGYKTQGKIYNLIKDVDFKKSYFQYVSYTDPNLPDYEKLKQFLKDNYRYHRKARWS